MAINDIGEQAMAAQRAREAAIRRVQQQTMPTSNPARGAGIAGGVPQGPASPTLGSQGANIAARPAKGPASDIRSQSPVPRAQNPVDRDFAQAKAEQNARFDAAKPKPVAPAAPSAPVAAAPKPSIATRAGAGVRAVAGAAASGPGILSGIATGSAVESMDRGTSDYYKRMGLDENARPIGASVRDAVLAKAPEGVRSFAEDAARGARDLGVRSAGVLSDFGAGLLDIPVETANMLGADIRPFKTMFADRAGEGKPYYRTDGERPAQPGQQPATAAAQPANAEQDGPPAAADGDQVIGQISGKAGTKTITRSMADAMAKVSGQPSDPQAEPQPAPGKAGGITDGMISDARGQDAAFYDLAQRRYSDQRGFAERSEERLNDLKGKFDTAIFQGKRRTAAAIAEAMRGEAGGINSFMGASLPDTRRNMQIDPNAPAKDAQIAAQASEAQANADKTSLESKRQQRIDEVMATFLEDPSSEAGQQAAKTLQTINGRPDPKLYPVDVQVGIDDMKTPIMGKGLFNPQTGSLQYDPSSQGIAGGVQQDVQNLVGEIRRLPDGSYVRVVPKGSQ